MTEVKGLDLLLLDLLGSQSNGGISTLHLKDLFSPHFELMHCIGNERKQGNMNIYLLD